MLKRLFWLSLFCAAFFLLLGLMVQEGDAQAPRPIRVQAFFALLPGSSGNMGEEQAPAAAAPFAAEGRPGPRLKAEPKGILIMDQPYHERAFQAFHYPDEAG